MASASLSHGALGTTSPAVSSRTSLIADIGWMQLMSAKLNCLNSHAPSHEWTLDKLFSSKLVCSYLRAHFYFANSKALPLTFLST